MTTILITLDGSTHSNEILSTVEPIAAALNATVRLFTVRHSKNETPRESYSQSMHGESLYSIPGGSTAMYVERGGEPGFAEDETQALQRLVDEGRDFLSAVSASLSAKGLKVEVDAVIGDDPAKEIIKYAKDNDFTFIAMATHGRSGIRDIVQGSVATEVVRSGVAPVLLVRPTKQ
ncbi:MAG: universal stress protein [Dehalococcoidia bacterium]